MSEYPNWKNLSWEERQEEMHKDFELWRKLRETRLKRIMGLIDEILYDSTSPTEKLDRLYEVEYEHNFWSVHHWSNRAKQLQQAISNVCYLKKINSRGLEPKVKNNANK